MTLTDLVQEQIHNFWLRRLFDSVSMIASIGRKAALHSVVSISYVFFFLTTMFYLKCLVIGILKIEDMMIVSYL